jgi:hypothetical protein
MTFSCRLIIEKNYLNREIWKTCWVFIVSVMFHYEKSGKNFHSHLSLHFLSKQTEVKGWQPHRPSLQFFFFFFFFFFTYRKFGKLAFFHSRISSLNASKTPHMLKYTALPTHVLLQYLKTMLCPCASLPRQATMRPRLPLPNLKLLLNCPNSICPTSNHVPTPTSAKSEATAQLFCPNKQPCAHAYLCQI